TTIPTKLETTISTPPHNKGDMSELTPIQFLEEHIKLIDQERDYEIKETAILHSQWSATQLQRLGFALVGLRITGIRTGMGGKSLIDLEPPEIGTETFMPHHLRSGDIVRLEDSFSSSSSSSSATAATAGGGSGSKPKIKLGNSGSKNISCGDEREISGVIFRSTDKKIVVALSKDTEIPSSWKERCSIIKLANDITYKRMIFALRDAKTFLETRKPPTHIVTKWHPGTMKLMDIILGKCQPNTTITMPTPGEVNDIEWFNTALNDPQKEAIKFSLDPNHQLTLIHGPPGTGKTYTIVEIIRQLVAKNKRVLVCGPSNLSIDNLVERLVKCRPQIPLVRVGHPARVLPSIIDHSLDSLSKYSEQGQIVKDIRDEMDQTLSSISKSRTGGGGGGSTKWAERRELYEQLKHLRKDYREREKKVVDTIIGEAKVVLCTLNGAANKEIQKAEPFDVLIIDEASQCVEAESWIPLPKVSKLILAGDHRQLPPTIKSQKTVAASLKPPPSASSSLTNGKKDGNGNKTTTTTANMKLGPKASLELTLFDRMLDMYGSGVTKMLTIQYRMNEQIMKYPSMVLYNDLLVADPSVADHTLGDLEHVESDSEDMAIPLVFYDTVDTGRLESTLEVDEPTKPKADTSSSSTKGKGGNKKTGSTKNIKSKSKSTPSSNKPKGSSFASSSPSSLTESKLNRGEADLVVLHVKDLFSHGLTQSDIAVISPYNAQVDLLKQLLRPDYPDLEIGSVDGFQGREKEAIILTLVRSNDSGEVGFLADYRRLNVAVTRARRQLCVIGDSSTLVREPVFLKGFIAWLEDRADLRYPD
ncbi:hypothetical protein H4219_006238, partial [Mycoemilia scoparia]